MEELASKTFRYGATPSPWSSREVNSPRFHIPTIEGPLLYQIGGDFIDNELVCSTTSRQDTKCIKTFSQNVNNLTLRDEMTNQ